MTSNDYAKPVVGQATTTRLTDYFGIAAFVVEGILVGRARMGRPGTEATNQENTGLTSVDRSTVATLITYNTRIQLSHLRRIYHFQNLKCWFAATVFGNNGGLIATGRGLRLVMLQCMNV